MIRTTLFAGALLAATAATMSPTFAAPYRIHPAARGAVRSRIPVRQARIVRAPASVTMRLPSRRMLNTAPLARVAVTRFARPAYGRVALTNRAARPAAARFASGYRLARPARPAGLRLASRGYGRLAQRIPAHAMRFKALAPSTLAPRAVVAPVAVGGGQVGGASYYSGGRTANGGVVGAATCAHRSLPFGTRIMVTNLNNARQTLCVVNDRGPFVGGRIVDLSRGAAGAIGMIGSGVASVRLTVLGRL